MAETLQFSKMHGLGNDFMVIDGINQHVDSKKIPIQKLANRYVGVGFDQLLLLESSTSADFACRIFNADGSEAEQCGNGMRCIARFIHEKELSVKNQFTIHTKAGQISVEILTGRDVRVAMGFPILTPAAIPFLADLEKTLYEITIDKPIKIGVVSMGNPHAIVKVEDVSEYPVTEWGAKIAASTLFPQSANVGFMEVVDRQHIRLRTYERGVGETNACGTNACAAVVSGILNGWLDEKVTVELLYGSLLIEWQGRQTSVFMTGPAEEVFLGRIWV
jgi:diaminopimelate epimerase